MGTLLEEAILTYSLLSPIYMYRCTVHEISICPLFINLGQALEYVLHILCTWSLFFVLVYTCNHVQTAIYKILVACYIFRNSCLIRPSKSKYNIKLLELKQTVKFTCRYFKL